MPSHRQYPLPKDPENSAILGRNVDGMSVWVDRVLIIARHDPCHSVRLGQLGLVVGMLSGAWHWNADAPH